MTTAAHCFPFGSPLLTVEQQPLADAQIFVLGVYSSAVHARWLNPDGTNRITALAVASEPTIFWRGEDADAEAIIGSIVLPPEAGRLVAPSAGMNGPSGTALDKLYLAPLGVTRQQAWLCDLLPQSRMNDGQAEAVRERYTPIAQALGLPAATVRRVPKRFAGPERVEAIAREFLASGARTLVTLGDVPLREFVAPLQLCEKTSSASFGTGASQYGQHHACALRGHRFDLLPLVHPRQAAGLGWHSPQLAAAHDGWARRQALSAGVSFPGR